MNILQIHKFHFPHGGDSIHYLSLAKLLERNGHTVSFFSTTNEKNIPSAYEPYFTESYNLARGNLSFRKKIQAAINIIYNRTAQKDLERLIQETRPDIAHVHALYHHLSPSILATLKKHNIPVVITLHDYKLVSANYSLFHDGKICTHTLGRRYLPAIIHRCVKHSYGKSALCALEGFLHRILRIYEKNIDHAIFPSKFMRDTVEKAGLRFRSSSVVQNFVDVESWTQEKKEEDRIIEIPYVVYFGRLSPEKGITTLLSAWKKRKISQAQLFIVGDGPQKGELEKMITYLKLQESVTFTGKLDHESIQKLLTHANASVLPSVWYENYPLSLLESFAAAIPVIASNIGGIPEIVQHKKNGLLFPTGDAEKLAECLDFILTHPQEAGQWGQEGQKWIQEHASPEKYYHKILEIYNHALKKTYEKK